MKKQLLEWGKRLKNLFQKTKEDKPVIKQLETNNKVVSNNPIVGCRVEDEDLEVSLREKLISYISGMFVIRKYKYDSTIIMDAPIYLKQHYETDDLKLKIFNDGEVHVIAKWQYSGNLRVFRINLSYIEQARLKELFEKFKFDNK